MNSTLLPPGPKEHLPGQNLLALHRDPLGFLERLAKQYGDITYFRGGSLNAYFVNHPDLIKEVLVTNNRTLRVGIWQRQARRLLGNGLVTSEGEEHLRQRRMTQPSFHHSRLARLSRFSAEYTDMWCDTRHEGQVIETAGEFWKLTLEIVAQSLFSTNIVDELEDLFETMRGLVALASPAMIYFADHILSLPLPLTKRFDRAWARLDATIYRIIAEHRERDDRDDLLAMLLDVRDENGVGMSDQELRDQTLTLLTAGHGTTSIALMWAFYLLSQHPHIETRWYEEIDRALGGRLPNVADLENMPFTRAILAEAMRLYPPVWAQDREATRDVEIGGYTIPKHSVVLVSQWVTQRDARFFPDSACFVPERWLGNTNSFEQRLTYFPFGVGPRICIGEEYAWMNGMLIMATLAQRWRFRLVQGHSVRLMPRSGLGAKHGMRMVLQRRERKMESLPLRMAEFGS